MTIELKLLAWTLVLAVVQTLLAATLLTRDVGLPYAAGPRDKPPTKPIGILAGRIVRAQKNLLETLPIFIGVVLAAQVANVHSPITSWGAMLFFWGRVIHLPLYALGIPVARTLVWFVTIVGLVMFLSALLCPA